MTRLIWPCIALLSGLCGVVPAGADQNCASLPGQSPAQTVRFVHESDGTTVDQKSQLMWMRCPLGQSWAAESCAGSALLASWQEGTAAVEEINRSGSHFYNDWRVPNLRELATVAEPRCKAPRINLQVFPGTPPAAFWTGTASLKAPQMVYVLDFGDGGVQPAFRDSQLHLRLVRSAP